MTGYYHMERGWQDHDIFNGEPYSKRDAWEWLISNACWQEKSVRIKGKKVLIKRGQLSYSIRFMAEKWGWHNAKAQRYIALLKSETMIDTENSSGQLIITICNYDQYQPLNNLENISSDTATDTEKIQQPIQQRYKEEERKKEPPKTPPKGGEKGPPLEDSFFPPVSLEIPEKESKANKTKPSTICRLPFEELPTDWGEWAKQELGWDKAIVEDIWSEFHGHWTKQTGKKGLKTKWESTWRIWCRSQRIQSKSSNSPPTNGNTYTPQTQKIDEVLLVKHIKIRRDRGDYVSDYDLGIVRNFERRMQK